MYAAWMCWRNKWLWYLQKIYIIFITRNPLDINACLKLPFLLYSILNQVCAEQVAACRSLAWSYRGFKCCKEIIRIPWIGGGFWKQNITWQNIPSIPIMVFSKSWLTAVKIFCSFWSLYPYHVYQNPTTPAEKGERGEEITSRCRRKMKHRENSEGCVLEACQHLPAAFWSFNEEHDTINQLIRRFSPKFSNKPTSSHIFPCDLSSSPLRVLHMPHRWLHTGRNLFINHTPMQETQYFAVSVQCCDRFPYFWWD